MPIYNEENWIEIFRFDGNPALVDFGAVTTGWLPNPVDGWVDVSAQVAFPVEIAHAAGAVSGPVLALTIVNESRLSWLEGKPVALVARHWAEGVYGARYTAVLGYLQGEGEQTARRDGSQRGRRTVGYAVEWSNIPLPALQFGRPNLMLAASFDQAKSVAALPAINIPEEAAFGEFISQADVSGALGIDGNSDTAVISSLVAELAPASALGNTVASFGSGFRPIPRIVRVYGGRPWGQPIGGGGETIFVELTCHAHHITWGDFETPAAVPAFFENPVGSPYPATVSDNDKQTAFVAGAGRNGSQSFRVRLKNQAALNPARGPYIQWNTGSNWYRLPAKISMWVRAASTNPLAADYSVGRNLLWTVKVDDAQDATQTVKIITLTDQYVKYSIDLDSLGRQGGITFRLGAQVNGVASSDLLFELDDLTCTVGYSDEEHAIAENTRFGLAYDNGHGTEGRMIFFYDGMAEAGWSIPPEGTVIVADDTNALGIKFVPGDRRVLSMRAKAPLWWLGPLSAARLKTQTGGNPSRTDYDDNTGIAATIEEILFSGLNWATGANPQALRRDSPVSTGNFVTEDYPRLGVDTAAAFGASYWTYDLKAFAPPTLTLLLPQTGLVAVLDNGDYYESSGVIQVENELITYLTNADGTLALSQRGYNPAGAPFGFGNPQGPVDHAAGTPVYPWRNGAKQTGHLLTDVSVYREEGTAPILDGKFLYTNEINPVSPSPDFERTAGGVWKVFGFYSNAQGAAIVVTAPVGGGGGGQGGGVVDQYVEARWLSHIVAHQGPDPKGSGRPQRGKFNEIVAHAFLPGAAAVGAYRSRQSPTLAALVGHLLVVRGNVPAAKFLVDPAVQAIPLDALSLAPAMLAEALVQVLKGAGLAVVADGLGYVRLVPTPESPFYAAGVPAHTWSAADFRDEPTVRWERRQRVSQVVLVARQAGALRVHRIAYPDIAANRGAVLDVKDVTVLDIDQARAYARAKFRQANAQRTPPIVTGRVADLAPYQRNVTNLPEADLGGQVVGVNVYVASYTIHITKGPQGSILWKSEISQPELSVG